MAISVTRRGFLGAGAAVMTAPRPADADAWPKLRPATIYRLYIGRSGATTNPRTGRSVQYLTWGKEEVARMDDHLLELAKRLGDVVFVGGETIPPADVAQVAATAASADGLLLIWLSGHGGDYTTLEKLRFGLDKPAVSFFQLSGAYCVPPQLSSCYPYVWIPEPAHCNGRGPARRRHHRLPAQ